MSDLRNMYNQQAMMANQGIGSSIQDYVRMSQYREESKKEKHARLTRELAELEEMMLDDPINGPTRRELRANEALNNAWNEFLTVWKLVGKK